MSFYQPGLTPGVNLEKEFSFQSEAALATKESHQQDQANNSIDANGELLDDDKFYECLDLDAVEEQAVLLFKEKSEYLTQKQNTPRNPGNEVHSPFPSFDLGI